MNKTPALIDRHNRRSEHDDGRACHAGGDGQSFPAPSLGGSERNCRRIGYRFLPLTFGNRQRTLKQIGVGLAFAALGDMIGDPL